MKSGPSQRSLTWNSFLEDHFSSSPSSCLRTAQGIHSPRKGMRVSRQGTPWGVAGDKADRAARSRHQRRAPPAANARETGYQHKEERNAHAQLLRPFVHGARQGHAAHSREAYAADEHHFNNHRGPAQRPRGPRVSGSARPSHPLAGFSYQHLSGVYPSFVRVRTCTCPSCRHTHIRLPCRSLSVSWWRCT